MAIQINLQETPNPNAIKINTSETIFEGSASISLKKGATTDHSLAQALVNIDGVDNIFGINNFVTITKEADADWEQIISAVEAVFAAV